MNLARHGPDYRLGFSSLAAETDLERLPVRGKLPGWLRGTLLRTGPAQFEVGRQSYRHWFDGLAMLHRFSFDGGQVAYRNRFLQSRSYREAAESGRIRFSEFATDPCRSLFGRVAAFFFPTTTDNGNVHVHRWAESVVALTETPLPIRFDPTTLATLGYYQYDEAVAGHLSTAHPHFDAARGVHYSYMIQMGRRSEYRVFTIDAATARQSRLCAIEVQRPAYMHSFGMSQNYLVLTEWPLTVHPLSLRFRRRPFIENYRWQPERGTRFWVIDKQTGRIVTRAVGDPLFAFHHVGAFEQDGQLVIDAVTYPDPGIIDQLYLDRLRSDDSTTATGHLTRFRLPTGGGAGKASQRVGTESLSPQAIELPRIDYAHSAGRDYRHVYAVGNAEPGNFIDQLVRLDLETGRAETWSSAGCYPGEPVFVAAPGDAASSAAPPGEGRPGVILSVVLDARAGRSFLLVLDAATFGELARAEVPHPIPFGFHGSFLGEASGEWRVASGERREARGERRVASGEKEGNGPLRTIPSRASREGRAVSPGRARMWQTRAMVNANARRARPGL